MGRDNKPLHFERGEWQISRVYAILGRFEPALYHAKRCLEICKENDIRDFDISFAYEAMARAYSLMEDSVERNKYIELAKEAAEGIRDKGDKEYFWGELKTISGYK